MTRLAAYHYASTLGLIVAVLAAVLMAVEMFTGANFHSWAIYLAGLMAIIVFGSLWTREVRRTALKPSEGDIVGRE